MLKWEYLEDNLYRMKIPGGWLVKYSSDVLSRMWENSAPQQGYEWRDSITFVPDPNHEWVINKEEL